MRRLWSSARSLRNEVSARTSAEASSRIRTSCSDLHRILSWSAITRASPRSLFCSPGYPSRARLTAIPGRWNTLSPRSSRTASSRVAGPPRRSIANPRSPPKPAISSRQASRPRSVFSTLRESKTSPSSSSTHAQWNALPTSKPTHNRIPHHLRARRRTVPGDPLAVITLTKRSLASRIPISGLERSRAGRGAMQLRPSSEERRLSLSHPRPAGAPPEAYPNGVLRA